MRRCSITSALAAGRMRFRQSVRSGRAMTGRGGRLRHSPHTPSPRISSYARDTGIGKIHIHQTRHTFARVVAEETGSLTETQEALGHKNLATTRAYVRRIAVRRDKHSRRIVERFGRNG